MEKFQPSNGYISKFYKKYIKYNIDTANIANPNYILNLGELFLFYPIEFGLGMHIDVQRININFIFESFSIEERYFILRYAKVPIF